MSREAPPFAKPMCGDAETNFFHDAVFRTVSRTVLGHAADSDSVHIIDADGHTFQGEVIWKLPLYGMPTGLCIAGEKAGYIVSRNGTSVLLGRPITVDGAKFVAAEGQVYLSHNHPHLAKEISESVHRLLDDGGDASFANVLVLLLTAAGYSVDGEIFLENVTHENLRYRQK